MDGYGSKMFKIKLDDLQAKKTIQPVVPLILVPSYDMNIHTQSAHSDGEFHQSFSCI